MRKDQLRDRLDATAVEVLDAARVASDTDFHLLAHELRTTAAHLRWLKTADTTRDGIAHGLSRAQGMLAAARYVTEDHTRLIHG